MPYGADFIHSVFGAVVGLVESMVGLRFLYALIDSALPASIEKRVLTKKIINMKLKSLNFFSRAALLLLTMMLTTATAWATVTWDGGTGTVGDPYYVNMTNGTKHVDVSDGSVTTFMVYDDGGADAGYSANYGSALIITAPDGYKINIAGSINTEESFDFLTFFDGTDPDYESTIGRTLLEASGVTNISTSSETGSMIIQFYSDSGTTSDGFALTVTIEAISGSHAINIADCAGGCSVTASPASADAGQTVTLTSAPAEGYVLGALSVRDADGNIVDVGDMLWYTDATTATFTMPASAVTVTPVFTSVMTAAAGLTVNMPKQYVRNVTIPEGVTSFKVYDYGGADCNYLGEQGQRLRLTAPAGCALQIEGTVTTKGGGATTFTVYDGTNKDTDDYLVNHAASATDGAAVSIPAVVSTGQSIYLDFYDADGDDLASLDLTVTVITGGVDHSVTVADATGGTMTASTAAAPLGQTVTLTATPADGNLLSGLSVTTGGRAVKTDWNVWTNSATFTMPDGDVTVTPAFTSDLTGLAVCLPVQGFKYVTIPEGVASFKIYDDGGASGDYTPYCGGNVYMTAAEGSHLRFTGSATGPEDKFNTTIDNTTFTATTTDIDITSTATTPHVGLQTPNAATGAGLDLTATVLYAVTIGSGTANGTVATDKANAAAGETVTLSVTPAEDCTVGTVTVNGQPLAAVQGVYSFQMPARRVAVTATFYPKTTLDFAEGQTWATYYHEEGVTYSVSDGAQAYYVSGIGESTVNLTAIDGVPSGLPALIHGSGTVTLTAGATEVKVTNRDARFKGTATEISATDFTDFTDGPTYVLYGGKFLLVEENGGIGAHKCWLTLSGSNAARSLKINVEDGETTAVANSSLFTHHSSLSEWYTLDGRKLSSEPTRKGLYIYKGKKVKK